MLPVPDLHHHTYVHANNNEEGNSANVSLMNMQVVVPNVDSSLTFGHQPPNISSSAGIKNPKEDEGWLFTMVYGSPCNTKREALWQHLDSVAKAHQYPWLIMGDFNEYLFAHEKYSPRPSFKAG
ncbi:unnamed protein product, partial [Prunus brigantina]